MKEKSTSTKRKTVYLILAVVFIILSVILGIILNANKKEILYNKKYTNDTGDIWIEFHKDGKCERSIEATINCTYKIEKDIITTDETQLVYGEKINIRMKYRIKNKEELDHFFTCYPDASKGSLLSCDKDSTFNYNYSVNNEYTKVEDNTEDNKEQINEVPKSVIDTSMAHVEDNYYYVCFVGNDRLLFTFKENGAYKLIYEKLKLRTTSAKYETDRVVEGFYNVKDNIIQLDNAFATITFGPNAGVITQVFEFNGTKCTLMGGNTTNTKEDNKQSEVTKDTTINNNNNSNSNNNSNNSNKTNNDYMPPKQDSFEEETPNTKTAEDYAKEAKEALDKVNITLKHDKSNMYEVVAENNKVYSLNFIINNKTYFDDGYIILEYQKEGENCIDILLVDDYNNERKVNRCINFTSAELNYEAWKYDLAPSGYCEMRLRNLDNNSEHDYNNRNLTCTLNGQTHNCNSGTGFKVAMGTYKMTIKNKYGKSQEIDVYCGK